MLRVAGFPINTFRMREWNRSALGRRTVRHRTCGMDGKTGSARGGTDLFQTCLVPGDDCGARRSRGSGASEAQVLQKTILCAAKLTGP